MGGTCRNLLLLLKKNYIIRKRHWIGTIAEIVTPACIFALLMGLRTLVPSGTTLINSNTTYEQLSKTYWQNHSSAALLQLLYQPQNAFTDRIMENVTDCMGLYQGNSSQLHGFDTESEMMTGYAELQATNMLILALTVTFEGTDGGSVPANLAYTIKTSNQIGSSLIDTDYGEPGSSADTLVNSIPFVALQMCVDDFYIAEVAPEYAAKQAPMRVIQKMPYPPYATADLSPTFFRDFIATWATLMFIVTLYMIPSYITVEKEIGVNALVKMHGVKAYQHFLSWLISGIVVGSIASALLVIVLKVYFTPDQIPFYYYSNGLILWIAIYINFIHTYGFCLHVASYFASPRFAQGAAIIIVYAVIQIVSQLEANGMYSIVPYLGFLFPTAAAIRIFDEFNRHDDTFTGVQWKNFFQTEHEVLGFDGTLGFMLILSILAIVFHSFMALYLEAVLPGKYGVSKSPFFFLKYFRKNKVSNINNADGSDDRPTILEPVATGVLTPGIRLRNLEKSFSLGCFKPRTVEAVRGISLDFYEGEITALLGHNGAGKSTTISILTGLTAPTAGTAFINGKDISGDMQDIRDNLGMCPQENILFPDLTVLEHLQLFGLLKQNNKTRKQVLQDVDALLVKLKISEKRNVLPKNLSGGQKRRVCLGIALIGDASTLILDEPTSGMDPETSRVTWDIILKFRRQKTIIITTHSMEEADVLGDRIAIMHEGKMRCYGTSMYLKKFYGGNCQEVTLSIEPWCDRGKVQAIFGAQANVNTTTHGRIVIRIPITESLPEILDKIESTKAELGITGMSVSTITLEEVFLKAAENEQDTVQEREQESITRERDAVNSQSDRQRFIKLTGSELRMQIFYALITKKYCYGINHWGMKMAILLGTLVSIILMPIFAINNANRANNRLLTLSLYPDSEALIYADNETLANTYQMEIESQGGTGTLIGNDVDIITALLERAAEGLVYYRNNMIISAEFDSSGQSVIANGLYSGSARLSAPITVNTMSNALLKIFGGDQYSIVANIENLPESLANYVYDEYVVMAQNLSPLLLFIINFFIVMGFFVIEPLLEATSIVKQLQRMTGVSSFMYWGTMFLYDYGLYIFSAILMAVGFVIMDAIFDSNTYHGTEIGILMLLLLLFGINLLLQAYILSFLKKPLYIVLLLLCLGNIVMAQVQIIILLALGAMGNDNMIFIIQRRIFSFLPHVSFTFAFSRFLNVASNNARCRKLPNTFIQIACTLNDPCCNLGCMDGSCMDSIPYFEGFGTPAGLDEFVLYLGFTPIVLLAILFCLEHGVFGKLRSKFRSNKPRPSGHNGVVDSDVANEKEIIRQGINQREGNSGLTDDNVFLAYELSKRYGNIEAVKEVNFRVKNNECFGLLGVNGAGKSTTFRMLVGEDLPTSGILIHGNDNIKSKRKQYLAGIGYCPQMDALIPSFNAYEHLSLFARLRGVPISDVPAEIQLWIDRLQLNKYAENSSQSYSGGNKRRLNIAIALIASPEMVLLDEPTAGVDPSARRSLWRVLQNCQTAGQAIILTSHSMEECEALCNRLLIMVRGQLVCVGASQQLKQRFGAGYDVTIKLNPERTEEENMEIKGKIQATLDCELRDEHPGYLLYHINDSRTTWLKMFGTMNHLKSEYSCIEDFTVSSATLEQLFIQFARATPGSMLAAVIPATNGTADKLSA